MDHHEAAAARAKASTTEAMIETAVRMATTTVFGQTSIGLFKVSCLTLCSPQAAHSVARFFFQIPVSRSQRHLDIAKVYCYLSAQEVITNGINYFIVNYTKFAANKI